jgi:hypothetical protein
LQHRVVSKWRGQRDSRLQGGESTGNHDSKANQTIDDHGKSSFKGRVF